MKKLTLSFGHSQTHDRVMAMVMGEGQPIYLIAYGSVSWLHCSAWPWSQYDTQRLCLGTSHHSVAVGSLSPFGDSPWLQKLNGSDAGRIEQGHPGPLGSMHHLVMVWVINCQPSSRLTWLTLSWACLPTQLMAPDSVNMASHTSPKLNPSRDCLL